MPPPTQFLTTQSIDTGEASSFPTVANLSTFAQLSDLVKTQFPDFVREAHPRIIEFVEAYYKWLEEDGGVENSVKNLLKWQDVDTTNQQFLQELKAEFLVDLPEQSLINTANALKNIKKYYRARGTEKSFRTFFRMVFGEEIEFYYPWKDVLKGSDGKWVQPTVIKLIPLSGDPFALIGQKIKGSLSNTFAFVEKVVAVQYENITAYEVELNRSSISGIFQTNEVITDLNETVTARISPLITGLTLTNPGEGYIVGQEIIFSGGGYGAKAVVAEVLPGGIINRIQMTDFGVEYQFSTTVIFPSDPPVTIVATADPIVGPRAEYKGRYINDDGHLSSSKVLQDSFFYQLLSYVIFSNQSSHLYREALLKQLHPAGLKFFGGVRIQNTLSFRNTRRRLSAGIDTQLTLIQTSNFDVQAYKLGPSYRSIERNKFKYLPYEGHPGTPMLGPNVNYWTDGYGNTQLQNVADFVIEDFVDFPNTKTKLLPDAYLENEL